MNQDNLTKVQQFYVKRHRLPSYREMKNILDYKTGAVISWLVYKWKRDGIIEEHNDRLIPTPKFFSLPFQKRDLGL